MYSGIKCYQCGKKMNQGETVYTNNGFTFCTYSCMNDNKNCLARKNLEWVADFCRKQWDNDDCDW